MGLEKNERATYLSIGDGKITKRVKEPTEGSVSRTTKENKIVHEEIYDSVSGIITNITVKEHDSYGKFWNVSITDGEDKYILQMNYSGGYSSAFLKQLPNVDFSKRVHISPSMKKEGDKKKVTLFINQNKQALKHYFTKDNPGELPQMVQKKVKGQMIWDDSDMMEFLENLVTNEILPKIREAGTYKQEAVADGDPATERLSF